MFEKYGIMMSFSILVFTLAIASGIFYLLGVCLKFDKERLAGIREIIKTFFVFTLIFFAVGWLTQ